MTSGAIDAAEMDDVINRSTGVQSSNWRCDDMGLLWRKQSSRWITLTGMMGGLWGGCGWESCHYRQLIKLIIPAVPIQFYTLRNRIGHHKRDNLTRQPQLIHTTWNSNVTTTIHLLRIISRVVTRENIITSDTDYNQCSLKPPDTGQCFEPAVRALHHCELSILVHRLIRKAITVVMK